MEFNLADLFEAVVDAVGDREAIVDGDRRFTYAEVEERANRLAHALADKGVGPGDRVGLWMYNCSEYLEGMIAAFKLRAVPVNVNYRYVAEELRYLFADAELRAVIHEADFAPTLDDIRPDVGPLALSVGRGVDYEALIAAASPVRDFGPRSADDLYLLYTGGTTGMPKGVMWRSEDIFFGALQALSAGAPPLERPEAVADQARGGGLTRMLPACPFMHGTAHWMAFSTLYTGGTVVIFPDRRLDPRALWELVARERVNFLVIVGDAFARPLVEALEVAGPERPDVSGLAVLLSGGAILSPSVKADLLRVLPSTIVLDGYGASETGGQGQMVSAPGAASTSGGGHPRFMMNAETTVLDDQMRPVEPGSGVVGRLARRGHIPLGYHNDPEKTAATFPSVDGVRWAVPGDLATVEADGTITLFGRGSVSINTGGEKVFPEEVEAALKAHPAVFDAVVVGVPDPRWGERVTAVVAPREEAEPPTLAELAEHCRFALAGYKVPRSLVLVPDVVRSPSGKPDYRWAKAEALAATSSS
ncbi:MAG: acyl-CoA synthetase [Acidimicrobiales bacterium]